MSKVDVGETTNYAGDIFEVVVEINILNSAIINFVCVFILDLCIGPFFNFNNFVETHNYINNNICIVKPVFTTLLNSFVQIQVCKDTTVDKDHVVHEHWFKYYRDSS